MEHCCQAVGIAHSCRTSYLLKTGFNFRLGRLDAKMLLYNHVDIECMSCDQTTCKYLHLSDIYHLQNVQGRT